MFTRSMYLFIMVTAVLLAASSACAAEDTVKGNLGVISDVTTDIARQVMTQFPPGVRERGIVLKPAGNDEKYQLIDDVFTSVFTGNGIKVFSTPGAPAGSADSTGSAPAVAPPSRYRLDIRALEFSIRYPRIFRSHLIGGKRVKRTAKVKLSTTLLDPADGSVVWVKEAANDYEDQFPIRYLERVEDDLLTFTKPERNPTKWSRMVEPVVVSGIIVGLIYLFFSNQSGD